MASETCGGGSDSAHHHELVPDEQEDRREEEEGGGEEVLHEGGVHGSRREAEQGPVAQGVDGGWDQKVQV